MRAPWPKRHGLLSYAPMERGMHAFRLDTSGTEVAEVSPGRYESRPGLAAWAAAALRFGTPSLASTAVTWWSTVLAEMNSFAAIAALVCPEQISPRTSCSRRVRPSGSPRVADLGPAGMDRGSPRGGAPGWPALPPAGRSRAGTAAVRRRRRAARTPAPRRRPPGAACRRLEQPRLTRAPVSAATSSSCLASAPRPAARASTASRARGRGQVTGGRARLPGR
jgi:hypothetical protein